MPDLVLRHAAFDEPDVIEIHERYLVDIEQRYGGRPSCIQPTDFVGEGAAFVVAERDGRPIGCGGVRPLSAGVAELKRMYVAPEARRTGVARALVDALEDVARAAGYREVWLETGTQQPEAIALYESMGYTPIERYGEFAHDERSRCFSKSLEPAARADAGSA